MAVVVVAIAAALAGCAGPEKPGAPVETTAAVASPAALVGLWRVSDAEGEDDDTWLRLDVRDLTVLRPCGGIFGEWGATDTRFIAATYGWSSACSGRRPEVAWLDDAARFELTADGAQLLDAAGAVVASLTVDGDPGHYDDMSGKLVTAPTPAPSDLARFDEPAPLAAELSPATPESIVGAWVPEGLVVETEPGVTFEATGRYSASDGCNGGHGAWALEQHGRFLATTSPTTAAACDGAPVPYALADAFRAGFDGETLVLLDQGGAELARFTRA
ncbi:META domain-containing protein [Cellulomonas sp. PhB150]|uniref:META domain-containing protein n=1 Tax=Cellulomonas sp. PhB150 TaxID=2485188 RepID=UPI0011CE674D|nr:META domain-containing protein [Cellulomonas sp. PhB150]